jgi:hypothetical protein
MNRRVLTATFLFIRYFSDLASEDRPHPTPARSLLLECSGRRGRTSWRPSHLPEFRLFMDMLGPPSSLNSDAPGFKYTDGNPEPGSIMAFEVRMDPDAGKPALVPVWVSREEMIQAAFAMRAAAHFNHLETIL